MKAQIAHLNSLVSLNNEIDEIKETIKRVDEPECKEEFEDIELPEEEEKEEVEEEFAHIEEELEKEGEHEEEEFSLI